MQLHKIIALLPAVVILLTSCGFSSSRKLVDPEDVIPAESYSFEKLTFDGIEEKDFSCLLEAEDGKLSNGATAKASTKGYSGEGYVDVSDNSGFKMTVEIPSDQFYMITVRHRADAHKENELRFNGKKVFDIYSEAGDWVESTVDGVFLEKGTNTITLGSGWSWFSLDSIKIENGSSLSDDLYTGMAETLSNKYSNLKTQNIYQYLRAIYGKRVLAGQCTDYGNNTETDALYKGLGKYPQSERLISFLTVRTWASKTTVPQRITTLRLNGARTADLWSTTGTGTRPATATISTPTKQASGFQMRLPTRTLPT